MSIALERRIQEIEIISLIPCLIDEKIKARRIGSGNRKHLVLTPYEFLVLLYGLSPPQRPLWVARRLGEKKQGSARGTPRANLVPRLSLLPALSLGRDG